MRTFWIGVAVLPLAVFAARAQQPDTAKRRPARRDSAAVADSIARADSIALVRELERIQNEPRGQQPGGQAPVAAPAQPTVVTGPTNPRLLPDISAVGDLVGDLTPSGTTQEDDTRFGVREIELAFQADV